ncbi:hypothetical protein Tco_0385446 [Tanacetum coccineum]
MVSEPPGLCVFAVPDWVLIFLILLLKDRIRGSIEVDWLRFYWSYNSLWRQFDSLVHLPSCSCDVAIKLKDHKDLMRLMQFLIGLDDTYSVVRSQILTTKPLPDMKSSFATMSRVKSHKNNLMHLSFTRPSSSTFFLYKIIGLTIETLKVEVQDSRKRIMGNVTNNASSSTVKIDQSAWNTLPSSTNQINRLMALIGFKSNSGELQSCVADKITLKDVLVVPGYNVSLISVRKLAEDDKFGHPFYQVLTILKDKIQIDSLSDIQPCDEGLPLNMWTESALTAVYLINRIPSAVLSGKNPYEMIYKIEPSLSLFKSFGCLCFSTVLNNNDKFAARSDKCFNFFDQAVNKSNEPYDDKRDNRIGDSDGISMSHDYADVSTDTLPTVTSQSEFMHAPCQSHLKLAFHVSRYLKSSPGTGISFEHGTVRSNGSFIAISISVIETSLRMKSLFGNQSLHCLNPWKESAAIARVQAKDAPTTYNPSTPLTAWHP